MLQVNDLRLSLEGGLEELRAKTAALLGVAPEQLQDLRLVRQSIDARKSPTYTTSAPCAVPFPPIWSASSRPASRGRSSP